MDLESTVAIHQLLAHYGHCVDRQEWEALSEVFAPDALLDASDLGWPVTTGVVAVGELIASSPRPLAHHVTNPFVWSDTDGTVRSRSKILGVIAGGRVESWVCDDEILPTPSGWRIARRRVTLRRERDLPHELYRHVSA